MADYNLKPIPTDNSKDIIEWSDDLVTSLIGAFGSVDMKITTNSNGTAIRWDNGLQICQSFLKITGDNSKSEFIGTWVFPEEFAETVYRRAPEKIVVFPSLNRTVMDSNYGIADFLPSGTTLGLGAFDNARSVDIRLSLSGAFGSFSSARFVYVSLLAIGFWK